MEHHRRDLRGPRHDQRHSYDARPGAARRSGQRLFRAALRHVAVRRTFPQWKARTVTASRLLPVVRLLGDVGVGGIFLAGLRRDVSVDAGLHPGLGGDVSIPCGFAVERLLLRTGQRQGDDFGRGDRGGFRDDHLGDEPAPIADGVMHGHWGLRRDFGKRNGATGARLHLGGLQAVEGDRLCGLLGAHLHGAGGLIEEDHFAGRDGAGHDLGLAGRDGLRDSQPREENDEWSSEQCFHGVH